MKMKGQYLVLIGLTPILIWIVYPGLQYMIPGWHTTFVTGTSTITLVALSIIAGIGLVYLILERFGKRTTGLLTLFHFLFTFIPVYVILIWPIIYNAFNMRGGMIIYNTFLYSLLFLILGQLFFLINIGLSLTSRR